MPDKEEVNWNEIIVPNKSVKLLVNRVYDKIQPKVDINWDDIKNKDYEDIKSIFKFEFEMNKCRLLF